MSDTPAVLTPADVMTLRVLATERERARAVLRAAEAELNLALCKVKMLYGLSDGDTVDYATGAIERR